jgi:hypothetical protein
MAAMMGVQGAVADEVNTRLAKATADLAERYASGKGGKDVSVDGPTGAAYKEKQLEEQKAKKLAKEKRQQQANDEAGEQRNPNLDEGDRDDDDDGGDDDGKHGDEDAEVRRIREQRLREIKQAQREKLENLGKGHGQYREVTQDEFLAEVTSSQRVVCHFYHAEFPRCAVFDHHISKLVQRHVETKFIKINAEKAPFFVSKLLIRTIPTVIIFFDGVAAEKIIGFEGLADGMPEGKEDEWPTIKLARLLGAKKAINKSAIVDDEEVELKAKQTLEQLRRNQFVGMQASCLDDDEDDFDLDNA